MPKLCQIIAVASGKRSRAGSQSTKICRTLTDKPEMLAGLTRVYERKEEDGDMFPTESKSVQYTVAQAIQDMRAVYEDVFNAVAAQDNTNCVAKADIVVDGKPLIKDVPVTHLLFLEKQLKEINEFVSKIPTLNPAQVWKDDKTTGFYRSETVKTVKTKKVPRNHVLAEATEHHPAQVQMYNEDIVQGYWATTDFSGCIPATEKQAMLARVIKMQEAVKFAREQANGTDVVDLKTGGPILGYIFGN